MIYKRIEIDLTVARQDEELSFDGYFTSFLILDRDSEFEYKINSQKADVLYSEELQGFQGQGVFHKLYITNEAAEGKAVIVMYQ